MAPRIIKSVYKLLELLDALHSRQRSHYVVSSYKATIWEPQVVLV